MNTSFKALSDKTRRQILEYLKERDMTAGEIADKFTISKPSISNHLSILKNAGLITDVKKGQNIIYSINMTAVSEVLSWFLEFSSKKNNEENNEGDENNENN